jgi:flagellar basal body rod protein FlgG
MTDIFQIASVGMQDAGQRMEAISQNAASASLPGYRRHVVAGRPFTAELAASGADPLPQQVDVRPGSLLSTGRPLDVAVQTDDLFFELTDGERTWLTRAGAFRVNQDGVLVGEQGLRVVGAEGDVRIPPGDVTVEADGRITQQGVTVATLQLFRPTERASLVPVQGSLLSTNADIDPAEAGMGRVRGGALEAANTDAATEMIDLMSTARQFESLTRVAQGYDTVLGHAIEKLAEV